MVHRLVELTNVEDLLRSAERFLGGNRLVVNVGGFPRSMLKFSSLSVGEVFGYQMATALGVRVARMQGFWTREAVDAADTMAEPGRIGVLVEHLVDWTDLWWDDAASMDRDAFTRALSLCAFDCSEWGSFGRSRGEVYFADLERLTPLFDAEGLMAASDETRIEMLETAEDVYERGHSDLIHQVLKEANRLGLNRELRGELKKVCSIGPEAYSEFLKLVGHPIDALLSRFAARMFGQRLNAIAEYLGQPTHEPPTWR